MIISSRARRSMICAIRSKPFCAAKRETIPMTGSLDRDVLDSKGRQQVLLALCFSRKILCRILCCDVNLSVCGLHSS